MSETSPIEGDGGERGTSLVLVLTCFIVILVVIGTGFVPIIGVQHEVPMAYPTSSVLDYTYTTTQITQTSFIVVTTTTISQQSVETGQAEPYSLGAYALSCNSYAYLSGELSQGWGLVVSYSAGSALSVSLFNSRQFTSFQSGHSPAPLAGQTGQRSGQFRYLVPTTSTYYLVFDNDLQSGVLCVGNGETVTIYSATGVASYDQNMTTYQTQTGTTTEFSSSTATVTEYTNSTSSYFATSTTTTTEYVGWICNLLSQC